MNSHIFVSYIFKPVLSLRRFIDKLISEIDIFLNTSRIAQRGLVVIYTILLFDFLKEDLSVSSYKYFRIELFTHVCPIP